jgi:hypothetical protein
VQFRHGLALKAGSVVSAASTGTIEVGAAGGAAKGAVTVDAGALLHGAGTIKTAFVDTGTLDAAGGTLKLASSITGTGSVSITSGSVLSAAGKFGAATLRFLSGGNEKVVFGTPKSVSATIGGFTVTTDTIDLASFVKTTASFASHTLTVNSAGGAAHLHFSGSYTLASFAFASDGHGGTNIHFV